MIKVDFFDKIHDCCCLKYSVSQKLPGKTYYKTVHHVLKVTADKGRISVQQEPEQTEQFKVSIK